MEIRGRAFSTSGGNMNLLEKLTVLFWRVMPNRVLFWAVNESWARATLRKDQMTWSVLQGWLKYGKSKIEDLEQDGFDKAIKVLQEEGQEDAVVLLKTKRKQIYSTPVLH